MKQNNTTNFFCPFPSNGAPVEWYWQGKTEVSGEKPVPMPLCPPQILHGLTRDRTRASMVGGQWLTAWAMAWPIRPTYSNGTVHWTAVVWIPAEITSWSLYCYHILNGYGVQPVSSQLVQLCVEMLQTFRSSDPDSELSRSSTTSITDEARLERGQNSMFYAWSVHSHFTWIWGPSNT
jgi:hypothetical protein